VRRVGGGGGVLNFVNQCMCQFEYSDVEWFCGMDPLVAVPHTIMRMGADSFTDRTGGCTCRDPHNSVWWDVTVCGKVTQVILHGMGDNIPRWDNIPRVVSSQSSGVGQVVWYVFTCLLLRSTYLVS